MYNDKQGLHGVAGMSGGAGHYGNSNLHLQHASPQQQQHAMLLQQQQQQQMPSPRGPSMNHPHSHSILCLECYNPSSEMLEYDYNYDDSNKPPQPYPRIRERGEYYVDSYNDQPWSWTFGTNENVSMTIVERGAGNQRSQFTRPIFRAFLRRS